MINKTPKQTVYTRPTAADLLSYTVGMLAVLIFITFIFTIIDLITGSHISSVTPITVANVVRCVVFTAGTSFLLTPPLILLIWKIAKVNITQYTGLFKS